MFSAQDPSKTMMSNLVDGVYFVGEVLDMAGLLGGMILLGPGVLGMRLVRVFDDLME